MRRCQGLPIKVWLHCCLPLLTMKNELVGGLEHFLFFHMLGIIIPTDFHIFQRGGSTTNQFTIKKENWNNWNMMIEPLNWSLWSWSLWGNANLGWHQGKERKEKTKKPGGMNHRTKKRTGKLYGTMEGKKQIKDIKGNQHLRKSQRMVQESEWLRWALGRFRSKEFPTEIPG